MTWGSGSVPDADSSTPVFFGGGPDDLAMDEEVHKWLKEAGSTMDVEVRKAAYAKALKKIAAQSYWVPLFTWPTNYAMLKSLNWTPTEDEIPRFFTASWK